VPKRKYDGPLPQDDLQSDLIAPPRAGSLKGLM
jgi:hypothetical protein